MANRGCSFVWLNQPNKVFRGGQCVSATRAVKYCILCKEGGKSEATFASHDTVHCDSLSKAELRAMLAALEAMDLVPNNQDPDDDAAVKGLQQGYNFNDQEDQSQGLEPAGSS